MKVLFVAGYGPITTDTKESITFYRDNLGLSFEEETGGYFHTGDLKGVQHFALWPLSQAAQSCFGMDKWPTDLPTPTSWIEFDVEDVASASEELNAIDSVEMAYASFFSFSLSGASRLKMK
jgi:catechol 2,3-dioxygenase-like lactoylglutathione lyase family enzyme